MTGIDALEGRALDAAVARALGFHAVVVPPEIGEYAGATALIPGWMGVDSDWTTRFLDALDGDAFNPLALVPPYSTDWVYGGPIVDRERFDFTIDPETGQIYAM